MAVTRDQFESGMTYDAYKAQMTRNREQFEQNEKDLDLKPEDKQAFSSLPRTLNVMALAEDWCGDVIANLPVLGRLAAESGTLDMRVFLRDQNLDLIDQYLKDGQYRSIPVFVFYPILIAVFGMRDLPIVVIGFLSAVVAMIINTINGLDRIPRALLKAARIHHMGPVATALRIKLPCAAPYLLTGVKLAVAYSFIGVIAAEFILSGSGLGYAISFAYNNFETRKMYALMLFVIILVAAVNGAFHVWEQSILRRRGR